MLTLVEFSSAVVVHTKQSTNAVDDQQAKLSGSEVLGQVREKLRLVLRIACTCHGNVVVRHVRVNAKALGDVCDALRAEGTLRICNGLSAYTLAHWIAHSRRTNRCRPHVLQHHHDRAAVVP